MPGRNEFIRSAFNITTQTCQVRLESRPHADVVELVDTLASGASARKGVGVRVSPSAPIP